MTKWYQQCPTCAAKHGYPCRTAHSQTAMSNSHNDRPRDPTERRQYTDEELLQGAFAIIEGFRRKGGKLDGITHESWTSTTQAADEFITHMLVRWSIDTQESASDLHERLHNLEMDLGAEWLARMQRGF